MTSPSPPPPPEGLPEEIVKAIQNLQDWATAGGGLVSGAVLETREARSALDTTILHHLSAARARAERAEKALGWQPISTAPTDRPITLRMPTASLPGGWFVVVGQLPDPDDDSRFSSCSTIYHYNGTVLMGGFRGTWTHWRDDAPPTALSSVAEEA